MKKNTFLLLVLFFTLISCEKDDICDPNTPTTPRLVVEFYNVTTPSVKKNVTNLKVIGEGMKEGIIFNPGAGTERQYLTSGTSISIPLKTNTDKTTFTFILNSGNSNPALIDTDQITFNYSRNDIFVSRACGFKINFTLVQNNAIEHIAVPSTKTKWMQFISISKNNVENENEPHLKVFF
jgi:hypothetical protein